MNIPGTPASGRPELLHLPSLLQAVEADGYSVAAYRSALDKANKAIAKLFDEGAPATELVAWQSTVTDSLLTHLWSHTLPKHTRDSLALIAVGGYGRAELHPHSDIDILILLAPQYGEADEEIGKFVTALWDLGLDVGHSVRDIAQCVTEASTDVTVITNLLESRLLSGSDTLFDELHRAIDPTQMWSSSDYFAAKRDEQKQRHLKFHGSAYRLEPNLKESPGGLRDIQVIAWLIIRHYGHADFNALVDDGFLTQDELNELIEGRDYLWKVRFLLHTKSARKEDRVLFDYQRDLASDFGYQQSAGNEAVELFMQQYYRTVTKIERLNEMLVQLLEKAFVEDLTETTIPINERFNRVNDYLEVAHDRVFVEHPSALLEIFQVFAANTEIKGFSARTLRLLRSHLYLIDQRFRTEELPRNIFLQLFREPKKITRKLRLMNRYGVLAKYLPMFEKIVGRMQYDLFHIYTVDEHTLMVIRNLRRFAIRFHSNEYPHCSAIMQQLEKPELLYLIGLFHDIAKGRGGDHSELGALDAEEFCVAHGLSTTDTELVVWTVRHHLAMSTTAQRKDISDPEVILEFAQFAGSMRYLDFLYLLTVADIRGTNPELWNAWKENLLRQLYDSTAQALQRGLDNPIEKLEVIAQKKASAREILYQKNMNDSEIDTIWSQCNEAYFLQYSADEISWHTVNIALAGSEEPLVLLRRETERGSTEIFIHVQDYEHMFSDIVTALDQLRLTIVSAQILTSLNGYTLDTFFVLNRDGESIQDRSRLEHIYSTLTQTITNPEQLCQPQPIPAPRRLKHFDFNPIIKFDNDVSDEYTSLFIKAIDRPGLLSEIGYAFAQHRLRVLSASIATLGETAEDVFFIQTKDGLKVDDDTQLDSLRNLLLNLVNE